MMRGLVLGLVGFFVVRQLVVEWKNGVHYDSASDPETLLKRIRERENP